MDHADSLCRQNRRQLRNEQYGMMRQLSGPGYDSQGRQQRQDVGHRKATADEAQSVFIICAQQEDDGITTAEFTRACGRTDMRFFRKHTIT